MDLLFAENWYTSSMRNILNYITKHRIAFTILALILALISLAFISGEAYFEKNDENHRALRFHGPKGTTYEISSVSVKKLFTGKFVTPVAKNKKKGKGKGKKKKAAAVVRGIEIDKEKFPITGIDVSKHSGVINWSKVGQQNISFAFIKSTEGASYLDPQYINNMNQARKTDIKLGDYHFFRFDPTGKEQAKNYLKHTVVGKEDLPPVLDVEEWGNYPVTPNNVNRIKKSIHEFIKEVEEVTCKKVIIYTNSNTYLKLIKGEFKDNPIWICSFRLQNQIPDREWLFWQHSHSGQLSGIPGLVDYNTFNGDEVDWCEYLNPIE